MSDVILKGQEAEKALPFIKEALDRVGTDLTRRMMKTAIAAPHKEGDIKWAAMGLANLKAIEGVIMEIIAAGRVDEETRDYAAQIAKMSPERRSVVDLVGDYFNG